MAGGQAGAVHTTGWDCVIMISSMNVEFVWEVADRLHRVNGSGRWP